MFLCLRRLVVAVWNEGRIRQYRGIVCSLYAFSRTQIVLLSRHSSLPPSVTIRGHLLTATLQMLPLNSVAQLKRIRREMVGLMESIDGHAKNS